MARTQEYTALTLQDFIAFVTDRSLHTNGADADKYELRYHSSWRHVNTTEGDAWYDLRPAHKDFDTPDAYDVASDAWRALEPERILTERHTLESSTTMYRTIILSKELFDMFDSVWTKKLPSWRRGRTDNDESHKERVGKLTLAGLLKRLNKDAAADVQTQVTQAQNVEKERQQMTRRNNQRTRITRALIELEQALASADALRGDYAKGTREYSAQTYNGYNGRRAVDPNLSWYGDLHGLREALELERIDE